MFSFEFCEISKNTFSYRTPPVAAPDLWQIAILIVDVSFLHILYEFYEIKLKVMKYTLNCVSWNILKEIFHSVSSIRVPKVPFRFFDKLKNEIQNSMLRFCFYFNKEGEIQITDYHFHV